MDFSCVNHVLYKLVYLCCSWTTNPGQFPAQTISPVPLFLPGHFHIFWWGKLPEGYISLSGNGPDRRGGDCLVRIVLGEVVWGKVLWVGNCLVTY